MLRQTAAFGLNHLLDQHLWARERLRPHAGQIMEFRASPMPPVRLQIDESGHVGPADAGESDLVVTAKPGVIPFLVRRGPDTSQAFDFTGRADLADTVRDLLRHLDWDAEEDLSRLIGDVAAHRMASAGRDFVAWQREAAERLAQNFAEYVSEEQPLLMSRAQFESLSRQNTELLEALERLEQRVQRAEASAATPTQGSNNPG
jgi:ubiquinone biosynthesis accessory factor UbiJ